MNKAFNAVIAALVKPLGLEKCVTGDGAGSTARLLTAAFLATLSDTPQPVLRRAFDFSQQWDAVARFYHDGMPRIRQEIDHLAGTDAAWAARLDELAEWVTDEDHLHDIEQMSERYWQVFFPEAAGTLTDRAASAASLRRQQAVIVTKANPVPLTAPAREVLFTSSVQLTPPSEITVLNALSHNSHLKAELARIMQEPQRYWYDHVIEIGVKPDKNPLLHLLRGLDDIASRARTVGSTGTDGKLACVLSVSGTHPRLQSIAREYVTHELAHTAKLAHLRICVVTEADARRLIDEVLAPAATHYLDRHDAADALSVFGVEGEGGRTYNFLKAIAAFWQVLIDPQIKATFSIGQEQAFPATDSTTQAGMSPLAQLSTPLWGAYGIAVGGHPVELGMLAGMAAGRDDSDTSAVPYPDPVHTPEQLVASHHLTRALTSEAEKLAADSGRSDNERCMQRTHIPASGNGILLDHLRRYRPFAPSFIGRGAAAAFGLMAIARPGTRLACLQRSELLLHAAVPQPLLEDSETAPGDTLLSDYLQTLYLSAYAQMLTGGRPDRIKGALDPFTSGYISNLPVTTTYLHFALHAESLFTAGHTTLATQFVVRGAVRLHAALDFSSGRQAPLRQTAERERSGWDLFYTTLATLEKALHEGDDFAFDLRARARTLIESFTLV